MIKKEYIQPEVKEIKLILPTILAGSEQVDQSDNYIEDEDDIASLNVNLSGSNAVC